VCAQNTSRLLARSCTVRTFFLPGAPFRPDGGGGRRKKLPAARASEGAEVLYGSGALSASVGRGTFDIALRSPKSHHRAKSKKRRVRRRRPKIFGPELTEWPLLTTASVLINLAHSLLGNLSLYAYAAAFCFYMLHSFCQQEKCSRLAGWCKLLWLLRTRLFAKYIRSGLYT
jgi:hypothetical protein